MGTFPISPMNQPFVSFLIKLWTVAFLCLNPLCAMQAFANDGLQVQAGPSLKMFSATTEARSFGSLLPLGMGVRLVSFKRRTFMFSGVLDANLSSSNLSLVLLSFAARAHIFIYGGAPIYKKDVEKKILLKLYPKLAASVFVDLGAVNFNFNAYERILPPGAPKPVDGRDNPRGSLYQYGGGLSVRYDVGAGYFVGLEGGMSLTLDDPDFPVVTLFGGALVLDLPL